MGLVHSVFLTIKKHHRNVSTNAQLEYVRHSVMMNNTKLIQCICIKN